MVKRQLSEYLRIRAKSKEVVLSFANPPLRNMKSQECILLQSRQKETKRYKS